MALGDSIVSICNIALFALGEDPIVSLEDNTKRAILCNGRYDDVRRAVLRSHPWPCAKVQALLAASATPPLFTFANAYPLPADFIRMVDLPENDEAVWEIQGNALLTDEDAPLQLVYVRDLTDPTLFDPLLVHTIAYALGVELVEPLAQDGSKLQRLAAMLNDKGETARLVASQGDSPREWDEDVLLRSRR